MFGNLGLVQHLQGVALGASGAADVAKRAKRLPTDAKAELKELQKKHSEALKSLRSSHSSDIDALFARFALPARMTSQESKAIKRVVASFVYGRADSAEGVSSSRDRLRIKGKEVAVRPMGSYDTIRVCPGKFGEDAASRKAANAVLDILGAGVGVHDRAGSAFLGPSRGGGRIFSPDACYTVQVNERLKKAAVAGARRDLDAERKAAYGPGGELEQFYAQAKGADRERLVASRAMDGMHRRRRHGKKHKR
jgi:hypothetical protein